MGMDLFTLVGKIALDMSNMDNEMNRAINSASTKFKKLGTDMTKTGAVMSATITAPIIAIGKKAIDVAADFEYGMSEVSAISGATGADLEALTNKAKEMGEKTKFSASDAADGLKYMAMAGWKTEDMLNGLEGILNLAAAGNTDLGTTSDIVTDALTAMGYSASDAGRLADVMAAASSNANTNVELMGETLKYAGTMAGTMGYSMEDVSLAIGLMANSGVKGSMAGTALNAIMSRLSTNTNGATDCIKELGVEFYNSDGTARDFSDVIEELRTATQGLTTEQKAEIASTVAGEEAKKGLLAILNATADDYDKLKGAINNCSGSAKDMADVMNNNLSGQMTLLKSQLEGLAIQFVTLIMPYLRQGVEWLSKVLTWISNLDDGTKKMIITIAGIAAVAGPVIIVAGRVISAIGSIIGIGGKLIGGVGSLIKIVTNVMGLGGKIISLGGNLIGGIASIGTKIGGALIPAIAAIPAPVWIVIAVIGALVAAGIALYKNWDEVSAWAKNAWGAIKDTVKNAIDGVVGFFQNVIDFVKNNWQGLLLFLVNPIAGGFKLIYDNCAGFRDFIDNFLSGIKDKFTSMVENIKQKAVDLKDNVVNKFEELKEQSHAKVEELKEKAVSKFEELKEKSHARIEELKEKAIGKFEELKEKSYARIDELKEKAVGKFEELKEKSYDKVEELKEKTVGKVDELKEKSYAKLEELKEKAVNKFEELKTKAVSKVGELKEKAANKLQVMKEQGINKINELKEKGVAGFTDLASKGLERFDKLKDGIKDKLEAVKNFVSGVVEKLKSFFSFNWDLPKIKLPHFSIDGGFSLNPPSIPHIDVEWYKDGGIMTRPTAFGFNPMTGKVMGGGEAGAEAIVPINLLQDYVKTAVQDNNNGLITMLTAILNLLNQYLPHMAQMQLVLDSGATIGALAPGMNAKLGSISNFDERVR